MASIAYASHYLSLSRIIVLLNTIVLFLRSGTGSFFSSFNNDCVMKINILLLRSISLLLLFPFIGQAQTSTAPQLGKDPIPAIIKAMTLEEKVKFVAGNGMHFPGARNNNNGPVVGQSQDKVPGAAGHDVCDPASRYPFHCRE